MTTAKQDREKRQKLPKRERECNLIIVRHEHRHEVPERVDASINGPSGTGFEKEKKKEMRFYAIGGSLVRILLKKKREKMRRKHAKKLTVYKENGVGVH